MNKEERISAHNISLNSDYVPNPDLHMKNVRDAYHYAQAVSIARNYQVETILDIGCFDGWLDFLLIEKGYKVTGVELIKELSDAAMRYAYRNSLDYFVHTGFFDEIEIEKPYDLILCFETLEHIDILTLPDYIKKMESLAKKAILISLPDQDHRENNQHLWTPTEYFIRYTWGNKKNFSLSYKRYDNSRIPSNWFITYEI